MADSYADSHASGSDNSSHSLRITLGNKEVYLIGTAHISRESVEEVKKTITLEKPDMVCVELDQGRYNSLTQKEQWENLNVSKVIKEGKGFLLMANLALSSFQRRLGKDLGVKPGEEMKVAVETATSLGIAYSFCDREVQITLRRAWARCGFWSKCKLIAALLANSFSTEKLGEQEIEDLKKQNEMDGMMSDLADYLPGVKETLIDERDRYMAAKIWNSVPDTAGQKKRIIAVIGAGHLQGIKAHLEKLAEKEVSTDVSGLNVIPAGSFVSKLGYFIFPAILLSLFALGFYRDGADLSLYMLRLWILWNGSLAALGAILARGHPLAILVSFLGAPVTTFIPFVGVGMFSGFVQASLRKPRVSDVQSIADDVSSLKGLYRNRISRALLVFFLANMGSSIGTFVSIPVMAGLLAGG
ncbi:MAG: TraB/GumN family protein [Spirochaetes bacterium]|nr:TraB/GumN family protein [Spirochaetota bacterium]